jgi:hypothetical protein
MNLLTSTSQFTLLPGPFQAADFHHPLRQQFRNTKV